MTVLLVENEVSIGPAAAAALAEVGATRVALLRDASTVAVVLEGWAFDPARSTARSLEAIGCGHQSVRTLALVAKVAISREYGTALVPGGIPEDHRPT